MNEPEYVKGLVSAFLRYNGESPLEQVVEFLEILDIYLIDPRTVLKGLGFGVAGGFVFLKNELITSQIDGDVEIMESNI